MLKTIRKEGGGILLELNQLDTNAIETGSRTSGELSTSEKLKRTPEFLQSVISQHLQVFKTPAGLPPVRQHEHAIILKEGSNPVSVRPYRYPQVQKDEVERLVKEMLTAGIIRPSYNPFSSPVLLVKKKMGHGDFVLIIGH